MPETLHLHTYCAHIEVCSSVAPTHDGARVEGLRDGLDESFDIVARAQDPSGELRAHLDDYGRRASDARKPVEWPAVRDRGNAYAELVVQLEARYCHAGLQDVFIATTGGPGRHPFRQPQIPVAFEYSGTSR